MPGALSVKDEPAFPIEFIHGNGEHECYSGMSTRTYFAGLAMQGLLSSKFEGPIDGYAVKIADALIAALEAGDK